VRYQDVMGQGSGAYFIEVIQITTPV